MARRNRPAYGKPANAAEWRAIDQLISFVYQFEKGQFLRWARSAGRGNARVFRVGGEVAGGLFRYPMGLWLGGRSVASHGIAGVGVAPERRASGAGSAMMRAAVLEAAAARVPLSSLYPATQPVYRQAGYEQAGHKLTFALAASAIDAREKEPSIRPARPADRAAIRALYAEQARDSAGLVDRTEFLWERLLDPPQGNVRTYVVGDGRRLLGYVAIAPKKKESLHQDLLLPDLAFRTPEAGRRILSFVASHRSFVDTVRWNGGPQDGLRALLREQTVQVERHWAWMVRLCDLEGAIRARGYAPGVDVEAALDVEDDLVPGNAGRWTLRVRGGSGRLARGGRGGVRCTIAALASVYTGFASPREVAARGGMEGPPADLDALGAAFAGPAPWNREMY
jgi:predicted acetyltransferase